MLRFRPLTSDDQAKLWHWLHIALWDPPPAGLRPVETLQQEHVRIYAEQWGRSSDVGVVAVRDGIDLGACWLRLLPLGVGLASLDGATPQLGVALEPEFQHQGVGHALIREALRQGKLAGYRQVSLTVQPENPAHYLYEALGFREVGRRNGYVLMAASLT